MLSRIEQCSRTVKTRVFFCLSLAAVTLAKCIQKSTVADSDPPRTMPQWRNTNSDN